MLTTYARVMAEWRKKEAEKQAAKPKEERANG